MEDISTAQPQKVDLVIDPCVVTKKKDQPEPVSNTSFLIRFHAGYFRISLSLAGQALLWRVLSQPTSDSHTVFHLVPGSLPSTAFILIWFLALMAQTLLSVLYILKCLFHFHMVRAEFVHHVGVNYLYTPWISGLLLLQSNPWLAPDGVCYQALWWVFAVPIGVLDVKIYGQWFTTEKRFLSMAANPTSQISVIGNLVSAGAAAQMGCKEVAICMFSLGMAHYVVLFVTLYQHLSGVNRFPAMLRPALSLFFAAPSMASLAWSSISGSFGTPSKMLFFLSLFLFTSLVCRPALFKKAMRKFTVAWWAYSFPLTFLALASTAYAHELKDSVATGLMLLLSVLSVLVFLGLMLLTAVRTDMLLLTEHLLFYNNKHFSKITWALLVSLVYLHNINFQKNKD